MVVFGNDWDELLAPEFKKEYYLRLREFLKHEYSTYTVYPDMHDIFSALKATSCAQTKIVLLGQDPYHEPNQAHGMCFSVRPGVEMPPSLINIFKELYDDLGYPIPNNGYLMPWAKQGVLLLNTVLTVRRGMANSHKNKGWEIFTNRVVEILNEREDPVIFFLWGSNAKEKLEIINTKKHYVLEAAHPSPLSANRGFFGCRHFSKANEILVSLLKSPINWQIENV